MRVKSVSSHILRAPLGAQKFYSSQAAFPERNSYLVRVETDSGLVGWGEGGQYGPPEPVAACVDAVFAPRLIGRDPTEPVRIWEEHYAFSRDFGQKGTYIEAISAIDIALWDIAGQAAGLPVWKLLGGRFRDSVTAYATGCYYPDNFRDMPAVLRGLEKEASGYADAGFQFLKIKVGLLSLADDIERLRVIRTAVGPRIGLLVDANHAYNAASAVRMGRLMEPHQVEFFEEPVTPEDHEGYRKVRRENPIAVAGGASSHVTDSAISSAEAASTLPNLILLAQAGYSGWLDILALAKSYGVATIPHVWGSGIAVAAALHAVASIPPFPHTANPLPLLNEPVIEFDRKHNPLRDELLAEPFTLKDGRLMVPDRPGLGVTVRDDTLKAYKR
jgi:D-galactarolactone cycloisomerase